VARITLTSAFRNSSDYLPRYFAQIEGLRAGLEGRGDTLDLALIYGDCVDHTAEALYYMAAASGCTAAIAEHSHGGRHLGSIITPMRLRALAGVGNAMLELVPDEADALLYVESDLIWTAADLLALLDDLQTPQVNLAFPMVMASGEHRFYDTWAYRIGATSFQRYWPYHKALADGVPGDLVELSGAGSCAAVRGDTVPTMKQIGFQAWGVWPDLVKTLGQAGYRAWLDPRVTIWHP
jgi:hypothetical protein